MPTFSSEAYSPPFLPWRLIIMEKEKNISNEFRAGVGNNNILTPNIRRASFLADEDV